MPVERIDADAVFSSFLYLPHAFLLGIFLYCFSFVSLVFSVFFVFLVFSAYSFSPLLSFPTVLYLFLAIAILISVTVPSVIANLQAVLPHHCLWLTLHPRQCARAAALREASRTSTYRFAHGYKVSGAMQARGDGPEERSRHSPALAACTAALVGWREEAP